MAWDSLVVTLERVIPKEKEGKPVEELEKQVELKLRAIKKNMEESYGKQAFSRNFFDELHSKQLTDIDGNSAALMYKIYLNAKKHYPLFKHMSYNTQMKLLQRGYYGARGRNAATRDIYAFSKATFGVLEKENLIDVLVMNDPILGRNHAYHKISENRRTRVNPDKRSEVWEYDCLIFVNYKYRTSTGVELRTSIHCSDLWNLLNSATA